MKKAIIILMMAALAGCSKKSSPDPSMVTIQYKYTANLSSTYTITYADQNNATQTVSFTGTTWSETFTASAENPLGAFDQAFFSINCTASPTPTLNGKMTIYANNKDVEDVNVPLVPNGTTSFSISYIPF